MKADETDNNVGGETQAVFVLQRSLNENDSQLARSGTFGWAVHIIQHVSHSSDHSRIVRSFSIDADAIKFRVGWVYGRA